MFFKTVRLQQFEGMWRSEPGIWKGYHLSLEIIEKGYPYLKG